MYYYSRRIILTLAAAITTLLALSLQTVTAAGLTSANTASAGTAHSAGSLSGTTSIADQARPDGAANWPVAGAKCKGDATSWCDMKMFIEATNGIGAIVDKVTIKFKITPHWDSADVLWKVTYQTPVHRYLHHFFVSAHVICLESTIAWTRIIQLIRSMAAGVSSSSTGDITLCGAALSPSA